MTSTRTILVLDTDNAPLDGVTVVARAVDVLGAVRDEPAVEGLGDGLYLVTFNEGDAEACTIALLDFGAGALQRYVVLVEHRRDNMNQAWAVVVAAGDGSMWSGAAPTVGAYRWKDGTDRLAQAPAALQLTELGTGVYRWRPTLEDMRAGATLVVVAPPGSTSNRWSEYAKRVPAEGESLGEDLFARLTADAEVAALVGERVFPNELPQGVTQASLVYNVVTDRPETSFTGSSSQFLRAARVQLDAYARTYPQVKALERAVTNVLGDLKEPSPGLSVVQETARDLFDHETRNHRVLMEFTVWR